MSHFSDTNSMVNATSWDKTYNLEQLEQDLQKFWIVDKGKMSKKTS